MTVHIDQNTLIIKETPQSPLIHEVEMDVTEDGDDVKDTEKVFRHITVLHNSNMTEEDFSTVIAVELERVKAIPTADDVKDRILNTMKESVKSFTRVEIPESIAQSDVTEV